MSFAAHSGPDLPQSFLEGTDPTTHLVAVEPVGGARIATYRRANGSREIERDEIAFEPWLIAIKPEPWSTMRSVTAIEELRGGHPIRFLVRFQNWAAFQDGSRFARENRETIFEVSSPVDQYLILSGRTLFRGMVFGDLRRLQADIETTGLDAAEDDAAVIMVSAIDPEGREHLLTAPDELDLIESLNQLIMAADPDVIEGHNLFNFDLPFLEARARRYNTELAWGRDRSPVRFGRRQQRFKAGPLALPFQPAYIHGRHIVDTYQQIQRYDVGGKLTSYGLKQAVDGLGLTRPDREFVPGEEISRIWRDDPARLARYSLDDVRDVALLSTLALPTEFYQTQLLPRSFQQVAVVGPGTKVNDLMLRAYLCRGESLPLPGGSRDYPGGHTELLHSGVFTPVVKCDVESLYPSIMLREEITPASDTLGAFLPMLGELTRRRLEAKSKIRLTTGPERAMWDGLQGSFKVLINSFYGYLGFGAALFNDFHAAGKVTIAGQRLIKSIVADLERTGAVPIEVDTDGVYFVPPANVDTEQAELAYIERIAQGLPSGIRLAHDGRYQAMLSLQLKNYALLEFDGHLTLKGSSLRSRKLERCFRDFIEQAARGFMVGSREQARDAYFALAERIRQRGLTIVEISQWTMIHDRTLNAQPRLKRLLDRAPAASKSGERIQLYEREDGELALIEEYAGDENIAYLLRRLHDTAGRFEPLFASALEFSAFFPSISTRTDLEQARHQESTQQLSMF
jgi:DNA polymerase elongation subunit (family B)